MEGISAGGSSIVVGVGGVWLVDCWLGVGGEFTGRNLIEKRATESSSPEAMTKLEACECESGYSGCRFSNQQHTMPTWYTRQLKEQIQI